MSDYGDDWDKRMDDLLMRVDAIPERFERIDPPSEPATPQTAEIAPQEADAEAADDTPPADDTLVQTQDATPEAFPEIVTDVPPDVSVPTEDLDMPADVDAETEPLPSATPASEETEPLDVAHGELPQTVELPTTTPEAAPSQALEITQPFEPLEDPLETPEDSTSPSEALPFPDRPAASRDERMSLPQIASPTEQRLGLVPFPQQPSTETLAQHVPPEWTDEELQAVGLPSREEAQLPTGYLPIDGGSELFGEEFLAHPAALGRQPIGEAGSDDMGMVRHQFGLLQESLSDQLEDMLNDQQITMTLRTSVY